MNMIFLRQKINGQLCHQNYATGYNYFNTQIGNFSIFKNIFMI